MRKRVASIVGLWLLAVAGATQAQTTVVAPSAAQRCLTRGEVLLGTPEYPQRALERKASGRVTVELEFSAPDAAPRVLKIDSKSGDDADAFERAVRDFTAAYRVPCLRADERSLLNQEFVFVPHDLRGVTMMASRDEQSVRAERLRRCMRHGKPDDKPAYPLPDLRVERQGTAILRVEFTGPDEAPRVAVLDDGGSRWFGEGARDYALGYRMPCHDRSGSVDVVQLYVYKIEGGSRIVLTDMAFLSLLRSIKGIRSASVYFDFNTMGCPFDVHFQPMQPHAPNTVGEVGPPNPERRFFLDWLSRQQLDLPQRELNAVIGQSALVSVPCTVLNLGQRSGGGGSQ
jgi:hypothetical protein